MIKNLLIIDIILLIPVLMSFAIVVLMLPSWIKRTKSVGLVGDDMNKYENVKVSEAGGLCVVAGFSLGILLYIALKIFYFKTDSNIIEIFALLCTVIIIAFIGMIDDIFGWKIGLSKRVRIFWVLIAAIPLMVINAGTSSISIPLIDGTDLMWLYPLFIIPIGIVGAATTFNFLAGYNGLESGMGILIIGALSTVAWFTGNSWLALIGVCMIFSLLGFLIFNWYPAKVFPGDVLTYSVGALIAVMAILGDFEKFAVFIFTPYILETLLKLRGRLKLQSFAKPNPDNSLNLRYKKFYGLEHIMLWFLKKIKVNSKVYEYEVVIGIWIIEVILIILGFLIFRETIFI
jgi:UDP-N-acetylglucosamine--dolichyl-phosphate N-acetylglucosaminephosphotransferase